MYEEFSSQISALLVEYCVRLSDLNLTDLGRGFVFSKVRVMSSVFGTALFVCISLGSSESWYSYGLVCFCCWLMMMMMMIFVHL